MDDRKKRLAALAAKAGRSNPSADSDAEHGESANASGSEAITKEEPNDAKFRNYTPSDSTLEKNANSETAKQLLVVDQPENEPSTASSGNNKRSRPSGKKEESEPPKKKSALEEALEQAKKDLKTQQQSEGGDKSNAELTTMAPKKINWDLKRDIQAKLDKLEKRTQKAIVSLLRERLAKEADTAVAEDGGEEQEEDLD